MSRHAFRSQPALQRSRGTPSWSLFGLGGLAALGLGFGAAVTALQEHPAPPVQTYGAPSSASAMAASAPTAPTPPPSVATARPQPVLATTRALAKPPVTPRAPRAAKPRPQARPALALSPQEAWERQRQAYERAVAAYDANESTEGYGWAQQNRIQVERYCRVAERRTAAFLQGCLSYVRTAENSGR